jgi:hypothetical protein
LKIGAELNAEAELVGAELNAEAELAYRSPCLSRSVRIGTPFGFFHEIEFVFKLRAEAELATSLTILFQLSFRQEELLQNTSK